MVYPIGKAPIKVGDEPTPDTMPIYEGTSPEDLQQWIWSLYRAEDPALVRGGEVSGRSDMAYDVNKGVAIFPTGEGRAMAVPFNPSTVATQDAPSSGTRSDYIYVTDDGAVQVSASPVAGTVLLDRRTVSANTTATTATSSQLGNRKYAPLFGGTMGRIAAWHYGLADYAPVPQERQLCTSITLTLESDRRLSFNLQQSYELSRGAYEGGDEGWRKASMVWEYWIDGVHRMTIEMAVETFAETKQNSFEFDVTAGTHTVEVYQRRRLMGLPDDVVIHRRGGPNQAPGTTFKINDMGGIE